MEEDVQKEIKIKENNMNETIVYVVISLISVGIIGSIITSKRVKPESPLRNSEDEYTRITIGGKRKTKKRK